MSVAVAGHSEQLSSSSPMTVQNRMSLDLLLTERGGVCSMFGSACCTFIPNNTVPDGSMTHALQGQRTLLNEMTEHTGKEDSLGNLFTSTFRKYKTIIISLMFILLLLLLSWPAVAAVSFSACPCLLTTLALLPYPRSRPLHPSIRCHCWKHMDWSRWWEKGR